MFNTVNIGRFCQVTVSRGFLYMKLHANWEKREWEETWKARGIDRGSKEWYRGNILDITIIITEDNNRK